MSDMIYSYNLSNVYVYAYRPNLAVMNITLVPQVAQYNLHAVSRAKDLGMICAQRKYDMSVRYK